MRPVLLSWASLCKFPRQCHTLWSCPAIHDCCVYALHLCLPSFLLSFKVDVRFPLWLLNPLWSPLKVISHSSQLRQQLNFTNCVPGPSHFMWVWQSFLLIAFYNLMEHWTSWRLGVKKMSVGVPALPVFISLFLYRSLRYQCYRARDGYLKGFLGKFNEIMYIRVLQLKSVSLGLAFLKHARNWES